MAVRGQERRAAIREVLDIFGDGATHFVLVGGCALGLYARPEGAPLRITKDVDFVSRLTPWVLQEKMLADLCRRRLLVPDRDLQCRYHVRGTEIDVDVLSPDGFNIGGANRWLKRAAERARAYDLGACRQVMAITPPYFLATKLEAFVDRGPDAQSSKDAEDIVALAVDVPDLVEQVDGERIRADVGGLWAEAFGKYRFAAADLPDFVDWHLDQRESAHRDRVVGTLDALARS
jgi:predicted nucleotidyltransferase